MSFRQQHWGVLPPFVYIVIGLHARDRINLSLSEAIFRRTRSSLICLESALNDIINKIY